MPIRELLMTVIVILLVGVFLIFGINAVHSGVFSAQQSIIGASQKMFGNSPQATTTTVNGGVATTTIDPPTITGVTWNTSTWSPSFTIDGYNFGSSPAITVLTDATTGWGIGRYSTDDYASE